MESILQGRVYHRFGIFLFENKNLLIEMMAISGIEYYYDRDHHGWEGTGRNSISQIVETPLQFLVLLLVCNNIANMPQDGESLHSWRKKLALHGFWCPLPYSFFSNVSFFRKTLKICSLLQRDAPSSIQGIQNCYENYGYATYPDSRVRLALSLHSRSTPGPFGWINFRFYGCSESPGCF